MPTDLDTNAELLEATALADATMVALGRFGAQLTHEELRRLVVNLDQASELLKAFQAKRQSSDLIAAMVAIDQVRLLLVQQTLH